MNQFLSLEYLPVEVPNYSQVYCDLFIRLQRMKKNFLSLSQEFKASTYIFINVDGKPTELQIEHLPQLKGLAHHLLSHSYNIPQLIH
jgi:hypothetical protein